MKRIGVRSLQAVKQSIPILSYLLFVLLLYIGDFVDKIVNGVRDQLSSSLIIFFLFVLAFIILPLGYILLYVSQYIYRKGVRMYKFYSFVLIVGVPIVATLHELYYIGITNWFYYLFLVLPLIWLPLLFFVSSLFFVLKSIDNIDSKK